MKMTDRAITEKLAVLEQMARDADLITTPFVRNTLLRLSLLWDDLTADSLYGFLLNQQDGSLFTDDVFELPGWDDLVGDLMLGGVLGKEIIGFRHSIDKLPMHILADGTSGSGKTNFAKLLIEQAFNEGVDSIKISDPKSEYDDIAKKHPDFLVLRWNELRFNPLEPPPNVPTEEWDQVFVSHLSQCFNFWIQSQSLLLKLISIERKKGKCPTIFDLLMALGEYKHKYYYKDLVTMSTVSSRLELMINACKDVVLTRSTILPELTNRNYILQTSGLMSEIESWLLELLLIWESMYRVWNPGERRLTLYVFDECQHRLFSRTKEQNVKKISSSFISMLVDEVRALNMGICSLSQEPSSLINAVLNNSWLKLTFHLGSGIEVKVMKEAMGLDLDQADALYSLETGEAIVRMAGGFMEPFPVKVDEFQKPIGVDEEEFRQHQAKLKKELYKEAGIVEDGLWGKGYEKTGVGGETKIFKEEYDELN